MYQNMTRSIWLIAVCCLTTGLGHASVIYDISMNTAPLMSHAAGPFASGGCLGSEESSNSVEPV